MTLPTSGICLAHAPQPTPAESSKNSVPALLCTAPGRQLSDSSMLLSAVSSAHFMEVAPRYKGNDCVSVNAKWVVSQKQTFQRLSVVLVMIANSTKSEVS